MDIKVKKADLLDLIIVILIFSQLVILGFFGLNSVMNKVVTVLILIRIILHPHLFPKFSIISSLTVLLLFVLSVVSEGGERAVWSSNFLLIFYPFVYMLYWVYLFLYNPSFIKRVLNKSYFIVNAVMILNIAVMLIQIYFPYSIQARITGAQIDYYEDTICGLFSYGSTHVVGLYCIFVVLYNLSYGKHLNKSHKVLNWCYTVVIALMNCFISLNNDNKAFFFLLPLFLFLYIVLTDNKITQKVSQYILGGLGTLGVIVLGTYFLFPSIHKYVNNTLIKTLSDFLSNFNAGAKAVGSNERIAIIGYALKKAETWKFGQGIATAYLNQSGYHNFRHFGQSDLGSFVLLIGIWFFIAILISYLYFSISIIKGDSKQRISTVFIIVLTGVLLILTLYTQCFSRTNVIITLMLIVSALHIKQNEIRKKESENNRESGDA